MSDRQHQFYQAAGEQFAPAIARLARAMERDADKARDLEQDIHCELFRSFARFEEQCALKTWVYRIAHNVAAEHRLRSSRRPSSISLDAIDDLAIPGNAERDAAESDAIVRAHRLIRQLPTLDAQLMLLWLEGESTRDIADVTGLSTANVSTRIHRLKAAIAGHFSSPAEKEPLS